MANGNNAVSSSVPRKSSDLPFRKLKSWPLEDFVETVLVHLRDTAQPETCDLLYRNPIPKDVDFLIVRKNLTLDGMKRPLGDNAPCPMCQPNKFLTCSLVYIPKMECCAVIGHCCAGKEGKARAEQEYRWRTRRDDEENYLLACLSIIPERLQRLESYKPAALEAARVYRRFRREVPDLHRHLRYMKDNHGGELILSEILRSGDDKKKDDYFGPRGFRSGNDTETREHRFGMMSGLLALNKDYNPVKELDNLIRQISSIDTVTDEAEVIDLICRVTDAQRHAAVAILRNVDAGVKKFTDRLEAFLQFFTRSNAEKLNAYGTSEHNSVYFTAQFETIHARPKMTLKFKGHPCVLQPSPCCYTIDTAWPQKPVN